MFYWLYDIPVFAVVALFVVVFVGLCWLGTIFVSPGLVRWVQGKGSRPFIATLALTPNLIAGN